MKLPPQEVQLVESNDDSREMVCWYLNEVGYQVIATSTCVASLRLVSARQLNLYLLGDGCEDGTTLALCQQIRAFDSDTPILFCSAWASFADRERGRSAGAQAYLTKPLDWGELERTIVKLIGETPARNGSKCTGSPDRAKEERGQGSACLRSASGILN